jgi:hypothetical protein
MQNMAGRCLSVLEIWVENDVALVVECPGSQELVFFFAR